MNVKFTLINIQHRHSLSKAQKRLLRLESDSMVSSSRDQIYRLIVSYYFQA